METNQQASFYVQFNESLCTGCALCVKSCPTKAIRIRNETSFRMVEKCIGCGECIRTCPAGALSPHKSTLRPSRENRVSVALVSPVLYAQFPQKKPGHVLAALRMMGFYDAFDMQDYLKMFQTATVEFIKRNRRDHRVPWPIISPVCPVVIRLVAVKFPSLLPHILPFNDPVSLMAPDLRKNVARHLDRDEKLVDIHLISACPAKITSDKAHQLPEISQVEGVTGINAIYSDLLGNLAKTTPTDATAPGPAGATPPDSARSAIWGMSGGEIAGSRIEKSMAVTGIKETAAYLEKIEMGLFKNMEYIEFRTCPEGCIGSTLNGIDKYIAKSVIHKMLRSYKGIGKSLSREKILDRYESGWFFTDTDPSDLETLYKTDKEPLSIDALNQIDKILTMINGRDCGICGSPDCRTFAEDVIRKEISIHKCIMLQLRRAGKAVETD